MKTFLRKKIFNIVAVIVSLCALTTNSAVANVPASAFDVLTITVKITTADTTPPEISIISPSDNAAFDESPITITGTAKDAESGLSNVSINVGGTVYNPSIGADGSFSINNVVIANGPNSITLSATDMAGNNATKSISVFLGWVLHLQVPYQQVSGYYSGAASAQMILNYVRNGIKADLTQEDIYNYGHTYNSTANASLSEMDPYAMRYALGHFDPYDFTDPDGYGDAYNAYNFDIEAFDSAKFTDYLRDIMHWMAYTVPTGNWQSNILTANPNVPPAVPAYGTYNHWVIVNGVAASENPNPTPRTNPWNTPNFTAYGLWLTDPAAGGIGQDMYVTAQSAQDTFFKPLVTSDSYNGMYLQVAEPPSVESNASVVVAEPNVNEETLKIMKISENITGEIPANISEAETTIETAKKHLYDGALAVNLKTGGSSSSGEQETYSLNSLFNTSLPRPQLDWKKIVDPSLLSDDNFVKAFDGSQARAFFKVRRADKKDSYYYLIPFDKFANGQFLTCAAIIINASNGSFEEASWTGVPTRFIQVTRAKAMQLAASADPVLQDAKTTVELIWEPTGISSSPFYPYWEIALGDLVYYVTQNGEVLKKDAQIQQNI